MSALVLTIDKGCHCLALILGLNIDSNMLGSLASIHPLFYL